jgi:hypothetical protein
MLGRRILHLEKLRKPRPDILPTNEVSIRNVKCLPVTAIIFARPDDGFGQKLGIRHLDQRVIRAD